MSKNTTRKGLAFGAGVALLSTAFVGIAPASATVNDNAVSLIPASGSQYSMVVDNVFDLKTTISSTLFNGVTGTLKFLVKDPDEAVKVDWAAASTAATETALTVTALAKNTTTGVVTVTATHSLSNGGKVVVKTGVTGVPAGEYTVSNVQTTTAFDITLTGSSATTALAASNPQTGLVILGASAANLNTYSYVKAADFGSASVAAGIGSRETDKSFVVTAGTVAQSTGVSTHLRLVSTSADAKSVNVTAWVDENGNGLIDPTEIQSSERTVSFVPWANSGVALTFDQPLAGDTTFSGTIAFDAAINASQITSGRVTVGIGKLVSGVLSDAAAEDSTVTDGAFVLGEAVRYNSTKNVWEITDGTNASVPATDGNTTADAVDAGATYAAQLILDGAPTGSVVYKTVGSAVSDAVGNVSAVRSDNVRKDSNTAYDVREKTTSVTLTAKVTKSSAAVANAPVVVKVTRVALDSKSTITAGGKSLTSTSTSSSFTYDAVTDASGVVTIEIGNSQGKAADSVTVEVTQAGISSTATTLLWQASDVDVTKAARAGAFGNDIIAIAQGGAYTLEYNVFDDFGAAPANDTLRVLVAYTPIGNVAGAAQTAVARSVPVVNGVAAISVTDTSTINGTYNVTGTVQKFNKSTGNYDALGTAMVVTTAVHVQGDITPAAVTATATATAVGASPVIEAKDFATVDLRADLNQDAPGYSSTELYTIAGLVTNSSGAAIAGAQVTIAAEGLAFKVGDVYTVGSVTVNASAAGQYSVVAVSHKSGTFKVTVTSGAASKTADITILAPAQTAGAALTIDAPATAAPGSTYKVTAKLVDKRGNGVAADNATGGIKVSVSYSGPGIVFGSLPTKFEADGTLSFAVLLGTNDNGPATITVVYDGDDTVTTNANAFTVARTVQVGASAGEARGWTRFLDATDELKIYARDVVGAGKIQFIVNNREIAWINATDANDPKLNVASDGIVRSVFVADMQTGRNVIEIYEDGVRLDRRIFTK